MTTQRRSCPGLISSLLSHHQLALGLSFYGTPGLLIRYELLYLLVNIVIRAAVHSKGCLKHSW